MIYLKNKSTYKRKGQSPIKELRLFIIFEMVYLYHKIINKYPSNYMYFQIGGSFGF